VGVCSNLSTFVKAEWCLAIHIAFDPMLLVVGYGVRLWSIFLTHVMLTLGFDRAGVCRSFVYVQPGLSIAAYDNEY
jgi:hypothetical protein